jgi:large subunit ribosomal protein L29
MIKIADIRGMRPDELQGKLDDLERHVFDLRAQAVTEKLENSNSVKNARRDIARVKTVMREQQLKGRS